MSAKLKALMSDDIHLHILKECCEGLCNALLHIFRKSLDTGTIPQDWNTDVNIYL